MEEGLHFDVVFTVLQRYDFESNSQQLLIRLISRRRCLPYCKGTILKAIHNSGHRRRNDRLVFTVLQRYDFESNSQLRRGRLSIDYGVYRIAKVRFWKQFTTNHRDWPRHHAVFTVLQRYDFESNSQQVAQSVNRERRCLPYCKGTILKAIHNHIVTIDSGTAGVYRIAKVRFWKQFTTATASANSS